MAYGSRCAQAHNIRFPKMAYCEQMKAEDRRCMQPEKERCIEGFKEKLVSEYVNMIGVSFSIVPRHIPIQLCSPAPGEHWNDCNSMLCCTSEMKSPPRRFPLSPETHRSQMRTRWPAVHEIRACCLNCRAVSQDCTRENRDATVFSLYPYPCLPWVIQNPARCMKWIL